jgi:hypothetical protein
MSCSTILRAAPLALVAPLPLTAHAGPPAPTIALGEYAARRDFVAALGPTPDSLLPSRHTLFTLRDYAGNHYAESDSLSRGAAFVRAFASRPKNRAMVAKVRAAVTRYNNIGVRIEDDYAITPNRLEWLSRAPREPAEIESAMARRGH